MRVAKVHGAPVSWRNDVGSAVGSTDIQLTGFQGDFLGGFVQEMVGVFLRFLIGFFRMVTDVD